MLLGAGVRFFGEGGVAQRGGIGAREVAIEVRASKTDQYNVGTYRNHYVSGEEVCPVEALRDLFLAFPERFGTGREAHLPLFRTADGGPLWRSAVQGILQYAAREVGLDPDRYGSHSLRIGGATALLHAGVPIEVIKRWGRWLSDSFQRYLWDANEDAKGLSGKMARDMSTLVLSRESKGK